MSHLKERKEKNCLNCGTEVQGKYCHFCGQENIEPKESVWHLVSHFFQDITHFDGKFFSTVKYLVARPGFLSKQYMLGRRASYLNPIRMYVFTSAFFFLLFFTFFTSGESAIKDNITVNDKSLTQIAKMDSAQFADFTKNINKEDDKPVVAMTREEFRQYVENSGSGFQVIGIKYKTKAEYDSALAAGKKHNWIERAFVYKIIEINTKYKGNRTGAMIALREKLLHSIPQMLFWSLPLLALLLKLLYIRRKDFYYVSHGIFSLHFYIFIFLDLLLIFLIGELQDKLHWGFFTFIKAFLYLGMFFYLYKAMRNFYQQGRAKTILKYFLLFCLFMIVIGILLTVFVLFSVYKL